MNIFLSKYINNLDKKGRVSVPASYRAALSSQSFNGVIVYPSFRNKCIEACSLKRLEELSQMIQTLDPYSEERDAFETIILGEAIQLAFDGEGRVILPKSLIEHSDISEQVCFVGKGLVFEIWQPQNFETYLSSARQIAQNNRLTLKNINKEI
ncbi:MULTISPECIES: division/cell wall cluster transcriptional repressor MraZ [Rickettsieae]|uniref:division/cell wall cluster transcriptional repressor MraZ n=1 Tax=Rickettsieae TaxID=33988 RepID=UPI000B9A582D|nr:division/cell wall cluster transcriptional repressor MraZ [Rickettsia endosymbiont of Culicoides newsteadi]MDN3030441.1 division/cell wall cluster transcriptional repressor MraZ [Candidatus Tisiphia sp.]OZG31295.1 transcriptional regulator MraZ [Rickettsia endosymbiont of Culicoides newsteadi]HJD57559.1 division/cell wall cluster transcriptional repressor MraZ [Rickettsia endosymbiont of Sericostoma sp. HW-2014]HJD64523.1 division/cell wall cluster transcriptional repressor MraZ [Rickettsia 